MAQDDSREKAVISAFDLSPYKGDLESRDARYVPDAYIVVDGERVTIELKSKPEKRTVTRKDKTTYEASKSDVSTQKLPDCVRSCTISACAMGSKVSSGSSL